MSSYPCRKINQHLCTDRRHRKNAFFIFLQTYRSKNIQNGRRATGTEIVKKAEQEWRRLPWFKKLRYNIKARQTMYNFTTRVPTANKVLKSLEKAIKGEDNIDLRELARAAMLVQKMKASINFEELLKSTEQQ